MGKNAQEGEGGSNGEGQVTALRNLLEHDYFKLVVKERVRAETDDYLKRLAMFAGVLLVVISIAAGFEIKNYKSKLDETVRQLQDKSAKLQKRADDITDKTEKAEQLIRDAQTTLNGARQSLKDSRDMSTQSAAVLQGASVALQQTAVQLNKEIPDVTRINELMQKADEAKQQADKAKTDAESARNAARSHGSEAEEASKNAEKYASQAQKTAHQLDNRLPSEIQLLMAKERVQVLVRGHKAPCVNLENWLDRDLTPIPPDKPQLFYVRFRVLHLHIQPIKLQMEVLKSSCDPEETGASYIYPKLPKNPRRPLGEHSGPGRLPLDEHPIPGTPFAFRMTFVFDPLLTYDFVVLEITPEKDLLQCPDLKTCTVYEDSARLEASPRSAVLGPGFSSIPKLSATTSSWKQAFGPSTISAATCLASYDQARNYEPQWGQATAGYARRFASR